MLLSQSDSNFLEVVIDLSDSTTFNENLLIQDIQTVYIVFTGQNYVFDSKQNIDNIVIGKKQESILKKINIENIDTLLIWGLEGQFDCFQYIQSSLSNINNFFLFAYGEITIQSKESINKDTVNFFSLNNLRLEGYGITIDLCLFNDLIHVKELDISNGNNKLLLRNKSTAIAEVWIDILGSSKLKWRRYKRRFRDAEFHKHGYRGEDFTFRKASSLNRLNLDKESNFGKF